MSEFRSVCATMFGMSGYLEMSTTGFACITPRIFGEVYTTRCTCTCIHCVPSEKMMAIPEVTNKIMATICVRAIRATYLFDKGQCNIYKLIWFLLLCHLQDSIKPLVPWNLRTKTWWVDVLVCLFAFIPPVWQIGIFSLACVNTQTITKKYLSMFWLRELCVCLRAMSS